MKGGLATLMGRGGSEGLWVDDSNMASWCSRSSVFTIVLAGRGWRAGLGGADEGREAAGIGAAVAAGAGTVDFAATVAEEGSPSCGLGGAVVARGGSVTGGGEAVGRAAGTEEVTTGSTGLEGTVTPGFGGITAGFGGTATGLGGTNVGLGGTTAGFEGIVVGFGGTTATGFAAGVETDSRGA